MAGNSPIRFVVAVNRDKLGFAICSDIVSSNSLGCSMVTCKVLFHCFISQVLPGNFYSVHCKVARYRAWHRALWLWEHPCDSIIESVWGRHEVGSIDTTPETFRNSQHLPRVMTSARSSSIDDSGRVSHPRLAKVYAEPPRRGTKYALSNPSIPNWPVYTLRVRAVIKVGYSEHQSPIGNIEKKKSYQKLQQLSFLT